MEYNAENRKLKTPPSHLRLKFLKLDALRLKIVKKHLSRTRYFEVLNETISKNRVIING